MTTALTLMILIAPFAVAAAVSWAAHRTPGLGAAWLTDLVDDDRDAFRVEHDADAIRTRFEKQPFWPASGAIGERR
jgi:hypothetical protein